MHHPFVRLVLLLLAPLCYFAYRLGGLNHRAVRWALLLIGALIVGVSVHAGGVDYTYTKRINLGLAALAVSLLLLHHRNVAGFGRRRRYRVALTLLAGVSWVVYFNFFSFHGSGQTRTFLHLHDVAHYYLGSKYFRELSYPDLYTAMVRAEAELYGNRLTSDDARDLRTNVLVSVRTLLADSAAVKAQFLPQRWEAFKQDVAYFHEAMGPQYAGVLHDFGYNPTPVWTLIGGNLANLVPAGSARGILCLALIDPLIEAATFVAVAWAFGIETMLLSMIYFCVFFGASFGWIGGAYLRYLSFCGLVAAICCLQRQRFGVAGALFGLATVLRVFPAVFMAGIAAKAGLELVTSRRISRRYAHALLAFGGTAALLLGVTLARPRGVEDWGQFRANMQRFLSNNAASNLVGLTEVLAYSGPATDTPGAVARKQRVHGWQLATAVLVMILFIVWRSRSMDDLSATLLAVPLIFTALNVAAYYYVLLLLPLICLYRRDPERLALLFAVEVATYTLLLFEDRDAVIYYYRSLLMLYLLLALQVDARRPRRALSHFDAGKPL